MTLDGGHRTSKLTVHALLTFAALVLEVTLLFFVLVVWFGASAAFEPNATTADARPGVELACQILVVAVPSILLVIAAWHRFWVLAAVQISILLYEGYAAIGHR